MVTTVYYCEGGCGPLYPMSVDHARASPVCLACGSGAHPLTEAEVRDRVRGTMRALFGTEDFPTVAERLRAVHEMEDLLRAFPLVAGAKEPGE